MRERLPTCICRDKHCQWRISTLHYVVCDRKLVPVLKYQLLLRLRFFFLSLISVHLCSLASSARRRTGLSDSPLSDLNVSSMHFYRRISNLPRILLAPQRQVPLSTRPGTHGNPPLFFLFDIFSSFKGFVSLSFFLLHPIKLSFGVDRLK